MEWMVFGMRLPRVSWNTEGHGGGMRTSRMEGRSEEPDASDSAWQGRESTSGTVCQNGLIGRIA